VNLLNVLKENVSELKKLAALNVPKNVLQINVKKLNVTMENVSEPQLMIAQKNVFLKTNVKKHFL